MGKAWEEKTKNAFWGSIFALGLAGYVASYYPNYRACSQISALIQNAPVLPHQVSSTDTWESIREAHPVQLPDTLVETCGEQWTIADRVRVGWNSRVEQANKLQKAPLFRYHNGHLSVNLMPYTLPPAGSILNVPNVNEKAQ